MSVGGFVEGDGHPVVERYFAVMKSLAAGHGDEISGWMALGVKLGLTISSTSPEYALALLKILDEHWAPGVPNSKDAAYAFMERVPILKGEI